MDKIIIGVILIGAGAYFALGIWFARFQGFWGRSPVVIRRFSYVGLALFPGVSGIMMAVYDVAAMKPYRGYLFLIAIAGMNIAIWGAILDKRAYCDGSAPRRPTPPERKKIGLLNFDPMPVLIIGIGFFLLVLWMVLFQHE
jgi:hypothetical protein